MNPTERLRTIEAKKIYFQNIIEQTWNAKNFEEANFIVQKNKI
jgi:hypothetical protein